ncbi:MAG: DNA repair protein RadA [Spirochaetia bacterium]|nr:DNA repair protein RadA [Spirochaetia bacterium]
MAKTKTIFYCGSCGASSPKWLGKCPTCGEFNTYAEEALCGPSKGPDYRGFAGTKISSLEDIDIKNEERLKTGLDEIDRVFGGGIVKGSLALLGGEPGVGKSTLALDIADRVANAYGTVLYVSGEESLEQIKLRADRCSIHSKNLKLVIETGVEKITAIAEKEKPVLMVIDSIQTVYKEDITSLAGTVGQVKESCAHLMYAAKRSGVPVIIIGHVTKDGNIAGPKMLEHMVDAVMYFEAEQYYQFKVLRAVKNRFGSTNEIGIFEMTGSGIKEVKSPSKMLLDNLKEDKKGSAIVTVLEGTRPLLLEIQALSARRNFGMPQRTVTGIDYNRFLLTLAILEKSLNLHLENHDIFANVAGGIKVVETGADLGVAAAIYSSFKEAPVSMKTVFIGELSLDGEVRPVQFMEARVAEAERLGFERCVIPSRSANVKTAMEIKKTGNVEELKAII